MQRRPNIRSHSVLFSCALQEICIDACHVRENALSIFIQYQMNFLTFLKNIWYLGLKFWKYGNCAVFSICIVLRRVSLWRFAYISRIYSCKQTWHGMHPPLAGPMCLVVFTVIYFYQGTRVRSWQFLYICEKWSFTCEVILCRSSRGLLAWLLLDILTSL